MVEKIWYCPKCQYVPQNIPYKEQPRTCPKCGFPCKEGDFVHGEDFKAIMEDMKRENERLGIKSYRTDEKEKE